jgi:hypothetical protein
MLRPDEPQVPVLAGQNADTIPELFEDLDFYRWMATRGARKDSDAATGAGNT